MHTYPTVLHETPDRLVPAALGERGHAALTALENRGFSAYTGLTVKILEAIHTAAEQDGIREFCPNDQKRFRDEATGRAWVAKQRSMVTLTTPSGALAAYGWFGPEQNDHIPEAPVTTAYRVTEAGSREARLAREAGAKDFRSGLLLGELVLATAIDIQREAPETISLETWASNTAARRVYGDLGFVLRAEVAEPQGRPTLRQIGEDVNGHTVFPDPADPAHRRVVDTRCFYALSSY